MWESWRSTWGSAVTFHLYSSITETWLPSSKWNPFDYTVNYTFQSSVKINNNNSILHANLTKKKKPRKHSHFITVTFFSVCGVSFQCREHSSICTFLGHDTVQAWSIQVYLFSLYSVFYVVVRMFHPYDDKQQCGGRKPDKVLRKPLTIRKLPCTSYVHMILVLGTHFRQ